MFETYIEKIKVILVLSRTNLREDQIYHMPIWIRSDESGDYPEPSYLRLALFQTILDSSE